MKLRQYDELENNKRSYERLWHQALGEEQIYKELTEAFGKKGIQALLIERSLPEIEAEANRLLGKMTDNRLTLRLATQRETKKGESIETLDIMIADELGTRGYEMYSGGEAFRIDMALRIALSKLLVMRAGASLSTLIIDEGFGTQDSSGREKLVETINSIQDDFDKIIVITHLEELRDAFPVRINVIKTAGGSTISFD
jgi:exonuclease SbcC